MGQEFDAPYSLDECAKRLKSLNSGTESIFGSTIVAVWKVKEDTLDFSVRRWKFLNLVTQISGRLIYVSNNKTKVISKSSVSLYLLLMFVVYMSFGLVILAGYFIDRRYDLIPIALFGLSFGVFTWYFWDRWRIQLNHSVKQLLNN